MKHICYFLLGAIITSGCASVKTAPPPPPAWLAGTDTIRVACIGDSITYGIGLEKRELHSYPAQLEQMLGSRWEVGNFGFASAHLESYLTSTAFEQALDFSPDVVIVALGINDALVPNLSREIFMSNYTSLIRKIRARVPQARLILCIPLPTNDPLLNKQLTTKIIPWIRHLSLQEGLPIIDFHGRFRFRSYLLSDGLHPTRKGATIMSRELYFALTGKDKGASYHILRTFDFLGF